MSTQASPSIKESSLVLFATFILYIVLSFFVSKPFGILGIAILELLLIVPAVIFLSVRKIPFRQALRLNPVSYKVIVFSALIGLGCAVVVDEISRLVQLILPMDVELLRQMQELVTWKNTREAVVLFLGAIVFAAFSEEILFRGFYQSALEKQADVTKAVMMTALIFTILHFQPWAFIEFILIGIFLGVVAWRANSVFPAMIFHAVVNSLSLLMTNTDPASYSWYEWRGHVAPWFVAAGILLVYFGFQGLYKVTELNSLQQ